MASAEPRSRSRLGRNFLGSKSREPLSLRWNLSRTTPATPAPEPKATEPEQEPAPQSQPAPKPSLARSEIVDRRQSKMSLFDLFSRPKVERARGQYDIPESIPERSQTPAHFYGRRAEPATSVTPPAQSPSKPEESPRKELVLNPQVGNPPRPPEDWGPPPMFQVVPQSIKTGIVKGTTMSVEGLIRAHNYRKQQGLLQTAFGSTTSLPFVRENPEGEAEAQESGTVVQPQLSDSPELVDKFFALVQAGRLVQYSGNGSATRMPERTLQLCDKSAAFACDLIPGKHWVVQVIQSANEDGGTTVSKSRSLLSRLRLPTSVVRRNTSSIIMVFDSAEDMDAWLKAIKNMIDELSGRRRELEPENLQSRRNSAEIHAVEAAQSLASQRSRATSRARASSTNSRIGVFSAETSPPQTVSSPINISTKTSPSSSPKASVSDRDGNLNRPSPTSSTEASSIATTVVSSEQLRLDQLREGSRHSFVSIRTSRTSETETATIPTSHCSSSPPSPQHDFFPEAHAPEPARNPAALRSSYMNPLAANPAARRRTMQILQPALERDAPLSGSPPDRRTSLLRTTSPDPPITTTILEIPSPGLPSASFPPHRPSTASPPASAPPYREPSRRQSTLPHLPPLTSRSLSRLDQPPTPRKNFFRPVPINPSPTPNDPNNPPFTKPFVPRRFSSLPSTPATLASLSEGSFSRPRAPSASFYAPTPFAAQTGVAAGPSMQKPLRRPSSMQIRSDPAPFLSNSRARRASGVVRSRSPPSLAERSESRSEQRSGIRELSGLRQLSGAPDRPRPESTAIPPHDPAPAVYIPERPGALRARTSSSIPAMMVPGLPPPVPPPRIPLPSPPGGAAGVGMPVGGPPRGPLPAVPVAGGFI
ncbi:hypothetical protein EJ06DRAFT_358440 [Trichodelitschia bisporula]|uniref:PH domain-containing protein n=1 Tax=Trichodelitschia bisporula TaxID=703511 RepID=A0A6G1I0G8_9PEZI|nr:hypothetical protein EJ06DRAFT_358440 [Trichodelitschia bisporula]